MGNSIIPNRLNSSINQSIIVKHHFNASQILSKSIACNYIQYFVYDYTSGLLIEGSFVLIDSTIWRQAMPTSVTGVIPTAEEYNDLVTQEELTTALGEITTDDISIGETTLNQILSIDIRQFGAHPITEGGYEDFDSTDAFQLAVDFAAANNIGMVKYSGQYKLLSFPKTFTLPGDDGTVYPSWVGNGDTNIAAESTNFLPVSITVPSSIKLMADNKDKDALIGPYNYMTGDINLSSGAMFLFTNGSKETTVRTQMENISISNSFIGYVLEGISFRSDLNNCLFSGCGIAGIEQGVEKSTKRNIAIINCYAGIVRGGWWTYRSNTRQTTTYMPPYPAIDVYLSCWVDADSVDGFSYTSPGGTWDARYAEIDSFF
ncbi:hypothetical protein ABK905_16330 [Acerihabitans sp. KWT182]|uniref:Pectate lyase superfamily protein domain-containing protein n=1 Tax=Acerihabitans sp. KWT182 TaxID=3157919 RepID=A0AAU7Q6E9_9GAMM